jgi:hypothetical protein
MAAGMFTAGLAVAAHSMAGGVAPSGAAAALLAMLACTVGALIATAERTADARILVVLLGAGQLLGHLVLTAVGHHHSAAAGGIPIPMLVAHVTAVVAGGALIAACDRLCRSVSSAVRVCARAVMPVPAGPATARVVSADQPRRSALLLAASVSHRGPPVSLAR